MDTITVIHEDRIKRLEDGLSACLVSLGQNTVKLESIACRFDKGICDIQVSIAGHTAKLDALTQIVPRITALEVINQKRCNRVKAVGKWVATVAATVTAALLVFFFR